MATSLQFEPHSDSEFSGPSWNNSSEYPSLESNEFSYDQTQLALLQARIDATLAHIRPLLQKTILNSNEIELFIPSLQAICEMEEQAWVLLENMRVYVGCLACVDGSNKDVQSMISQLTATAGTLEASTKPVFVYLTTAPEQILEKYFAHAHVKPYEFIIRERRKVADTLLSEAEESLIARLKAHGPLAFGTLYNQLSSTIRCNYENPVTKQFQQIGLAEAAGLIRDGDPAKREAAWRSIQLGWKTQETAAAAILNGLAGWRLELNDQRSKRRLAKSPQKAELHFLELAIHESRISPECLSAMFGAVHTKIEVPRRAMRAMAKAMGKPKLDPWDLLAPAPGPDENGAPQRLTFEKGFGLIRDAFYDIDPSLADFADTMKKNRWIEGRQLPNKRPGAFCTEYPKSNSPRVFQTYMGSTNDVRTLAHELGHAYHSWVMRDLPRPLTHYPMTLAESASIFAETAFADSLSKKALASGDHALALRTAWQNAEAATSLLNIPARFDFEKSFYERRQTGTVSPEELNQLMSQAWEKWYGDTLTDYEKQYWMTKLHFSIAEVSFYNYPYTFGYLFSLGIYALRDELGDRFWATYTALLRDTGRMSAEELAQTYLGADLTKPAFWLKSLALVEKQVSDFEALSEKRSITY